MLEGKRHHAKHGPWQEEQTEQITSLALAQYPAEVKLKHAKQRKQCSPCQGQSCALGQEIHASALAQSTQVLGGSSTNTKALD